MAMLNNQRVLKTIVNPLSKLVDPRHRMEVLREQLEGDLMRRELVAASARQFPWSKRRLNRANNWDLTNQKPPNWFNQQLGSNLFCWFKYHFFLGI